MTYLRNDTKHLMKRTYYILIALFYFNFSTNAQEVKHIESEIGILYQFSIKQQKVWEKTWKLLNQINDFKIDYDSLSMVERYQVDELEMGEGPIAESGDTWNSVAYPYKTEVSSELPPNGLTNYRGLNLKDNNLLTAWIPNNKNSGIGERITFYFKRNNPRVNKISIFNGYLKNKHLWSQNSRVKTIRMFVNNKEFAILHLKDKPTSHSFIFEPLQSKDNDLVITLEIFEIYKGTKWNDVAISEITFDGLDVF